MRLSLRVHIVLCLSLASAGFAGHALGQSQSTPPGSPQPSGVTLHVNSRLTLVDITVTDSKGHPIHGLTQADFTVKEDGKPQPIRSFQEYGLAIPAAQPAAPKLPPNTYTNLPAPLIPGSAINILLLDSLNTQPSSQIYARSEATKYLKEMSPGTQVSIFQLSNLGLRTVQGFTTDPTLLSAAMNSIVTVPLDPPPASPNDFCTEEDGRNRTRLEVLNRIAERMTAIKGRKNLIWLMEGIATLENTGLRERINMAMKRQCLPDYAMDLRKTYGLLNAAEVAIYPVDPRGLATNPGAGAQAGGGRTGRPPVNTNGFERRTEDDHASMEAIAEATGGEARYNDNDIAGVVRHAIDTSANYYSVSYVPPDLNFDGKHHTIEVKIDRPGVHLEYRKGYNADDIAQLAKTAEKPVAAAVPVANQSHLGPLMARGVPTSTDLLFDVRVEPEPAPAAPPPLGALDPKLARKPLTRYDFHYVVAANQLTFADAPDGTHKSSLIVDIAAYDGQGKMVTNVSQTTSFPLNADAYKNLSAVNLRCLQQIDLPPGAIFLRVGMLDTATNKVGTLEIPLNIGKGTVAKK